MRTEARIEVIEYQTGLHRSYALLRINANHITQVFSAIDDQRCPTVWPHCDVPAPRGKSAHPPPRQSAAPYARLLRYAV